MADFSSFLLADGVATSLRRDLLPMKQYFRDVDWQNLLCNKLTLDEQVDIFNETVSNTILSIVPKIKVGNFKFPKWFSVELKNTRGRSGGTGHLRKNPKLASLK